MRLAIVGAGPAGLMAAEVASAAGAEVTVFEKMPTPGRRFLMAGVGGLNLSSSEGYEAFLTHYTQGRDWLARLLGAFGPQDVRDWADGLGAETFAGSSGRVFPKAMKASPLLRSWLARLEVQGVQLALRHRWTGWDGDALEFDAPDGPITALADSTVLALGGASWPRLGADGTWVPVLRDAGAEVSPLMASNCGVRIAWTEVTQARFAGTPLKNIVLRCGDISVRGEAVLSHEGMEGGAVYALGPTLRAAKGAGLRIDLKPDLQAAEITKRLEAVCKGESLANRLRKAVKLGPVAAALLREAGDVPGAPEALAARLKDLPLAVTGLASLDRAISTAGGVEARSVDAAQMLCARPGTFVAGEMLDWDAPTGGYLMTACLASGRAAALGALAHMG